jgi:hypothetical protein
MYNRWLKISSYFKKHGMKNTIKRIFFHVKFKIKSEIVSNKNNLYKITQKKYCFKNRKKSIHYNGKPLSL